MRSIYCVMVLMGGLAWSASVQAGGETDEMDSATPPMQTASPSFRINTPIPPLGEDGEAAGLDEASSNPSPDVQNEAFGHKVFDSLKGQMRLAEVFFHIENLKFSEEAIRYEPTVSKISAFLQSWPHQSIARKKQFQDNEIKNNHNALKDSLDQMNARALFIQEFCERLNIAAQLQTDDIEVISAFIQTLRVVLENISTYKKEAQDLIGQMQSITTNMDTLLKTD